jgi:hypothetical protein
MTFYCIAFMKLLFTQFIKSNKLGSSSLKIFLPNNAMAILFTASLLLYFKALSLYLVLSSISSQLKPSMYLYSIISLCIGFYGLMLCGDELDDEALLLLRDSIRTTIKLMRANKK